MIKTAFVGADGLRQPLVHYGKAILDAINFGEKVSCGYNPVFKDYGVVRFECNGSRQVIPNYAVPKMSAGSLPGIHAANNSLVLERTYPYFGG